MSNAMSDGWLVVGWAVGVFVATQFVAAYEKRHRLHHVPFIGWFFATFCLAWPVAVVVFAFWVLLTAALSPLLLIPSFRRSISEGPGGRV